MRIMIVVPGFPSDTQQIKGGVHSALLNLLEGLSQESVEVIVVSFNKQIQNKTINCFENVQLMYINEGVFPFHAMNYLFVGSFQLYRLSKKYQPDIIHFMVGNSLLFTKLLLHKRTVLIQTIHGISKLEADKKISKVEKYKWKFNSLLQNKMHVDHVIHLSKYSEKLHEGFHFKKNEIIPNIVTRNYFDIPIKQNYNRKLLYVGIINPNKNLLFLLKMMVELKKMNKKFTLEVAGDFADPIYRKIIEDYITNNSLQDSVKINGWCTVLKVIELIAESDVTVLCSKQESYPMAVAESMAAGKIVMANAVGGVPEMIKDESSGLLFDIASPDTFLHKLLMIDQNEDERMKMQLEAKRIARQLFDMKKLAEKTVSYYHQCLQSTDHD